MIIRRTVKMFGEIAVEKGYVTEEDVRKALKIQQELKKQGTSELIGIVMLENDMLSNEQIIDILRYYEHH